MAAYLPEMLITMWRHQTFSYSGCTRTKKADHAVLESNFLTHWQVAARAPLLVPCEGHSEASVRCRELLKSMREDSWMPHEHDSVEAAFLEQLVCAKSRLFVGTRGSTFSEVIVHERVRGGWPLDTNYLVP